MTVLLSYELDRDHVDPDPPGSIAIALRRGANGTCVPPGDAGWVPCQPCFPARHGIPDDVGGASGPPSRNNRGWKRRPVARSQEGEAAPSARAGGAISPTNPAPWEW